jgi:hypothetical protein
MHQIAAAFFGAAAREQERPAISRQRDDVAVFFLDEFLHGGSSVVSSSGSSNSVALTAGHFSENRTTYCLECCGGRISTKPLPDDAPKLLPLVLR